MTLTLVTAQTVTVPPSYETVSGGPPAGNFALSDGWLEYTNPTTLQTKMWTFGIDSSNNLIVTSPADKVVNDATNILYSMAGYDRVIVNNGAGGNLYIGCLAPSSTDVSLIGPLNGPTPGNGGGVAFDPHSGLLFVDPTGTQSVTLYQIFNDGTHTVLGTGLTIPWWATFVVGAGHSVNAPLIAYSPGVFLSSDGKSQAMAVSPYTVSNAFSDGSSHTLYVPNAFAPALATSSILTNPILIESADFITVTNWQYDGNFFTNKGIIAGLITTPQAHLTVAQCLPRYIDAAGSLSYDYYGDVTDGVDYQLEFVIDNLGVDGGPYSWLCTTNPSKYAGQKVPLSVIQSATGGISQVHTGTYFLAPNIMLSGSTPQLAYNIIDARRYPRAQVSNKYTVSN